MQFIETVALNTDYLEDQKFLNQYIQILTLIGIKNLSAEV